MTFSIVDDVRRTVLSKAEYFRDFCEKVEENRGWWVRVPCDIIIDSTYSPFENISIWPGYEWKFDYKDVLWVKASPIEDHLNGRA